MNHLEIYSPKLYSRQVCRQSVFTLSSYFVDTHTGFNNTLSPAKLAGRVLSEENVLRVNAAGMIISFHDHQTTTR